MGHVDSDGDSDLSPRDWIRLVALYLFLPLILFFCAGDVLWWQAWLYGLLLFSSGIGGRLWAERRHPGLLAERSRSLEADNVKEWDKILAPLMAITISFPLVIVAGLDHRLGWSDPFGTSINLFGVVMVALGYAVSVWALAENRFFSSLVRIQTERGHVVCDTGPYRWVRHPGYAGNLLALPGIVLALDSTWTLLPVAVAVVVTFVRTALEDRVLKDELSGYSDYARRVRYRLIPGIY